MSLFYDILPEAATREYYILPDLQPCCSIFWPSKSQIYVNFFFKKIAISWNIMKFFFWNFLSLRIEEIFFLKFFLVLIQSIKLTWSNFCWILFSQLGDRKKMPILYHFFCRGTVPETRWEPIFFLSSSWLSQAAWESLLRV